MTDINITPMRLAVLRYLQERTGGAHASTLVYECCPRSTDVGRSYGWSAQGAARMGGKLVAALERAGMVKRSRGDSRFEPDTFRITDAGRAAIQRAALEELRRFAAQTS